jgi:hypothetical protein
MTELDFDKPLRPSKHLRNTWMRKWDWDVHDLRRALKEAHKIERVGRRKYELHTGYRAERGRSRKLVLVDYPEEIFIITGAEGSR